MIKGLLKRSGIYFSGLTAGRLITTLAYIFLARHFLPNEFGQIVLYSTILNIAGALGNFGLNQILQKSDPSKLISTFQKVICARIVSYSVSFLLIALGLLFFNPFSVFISFMLLLTLLPESLVSLLDGYYIFTKNPLPAALSYPMRVVWILIGLLLIPGLSFNTVAVLYCLGSLTVLLLWFPRSFWRTNVLTNWKETFAMLSNSSHYALLTLTAFTYARGDSLIVRAQLNSSSLGLYSAGYRYLDSLSLIPSALNQNLFSLAASKESVSKKQLGLITLLMIFAGSVTSVVLFFAAPFLTTTLLGPAYSESLPVVRILATTLFLLFINAPLSAVVQSSGLLKKFLPWGIANTLLNLILNWICVPIGGITAAAWVMTATEISGLCINAYFVYKMYRHD